MNVREMSYPIKVYGQYYWTTSPRSGYVPLEGAVVAGGEDIIMEIESPDADERHCPSCGAPVAEYMGGWKGCREGCEHEGYEPPATAASIFNSASIEVDADEARVRVHISHSDPRGAFTMELRQTSDGTLLLHVPHPDDSQPHATLREHHPGTYIVEGS